MLLEEWENHLSHTRLNIFLDCIKNRYRGTQLVVTTHNSFVANKLELKNLILVKDDRSIALNDLAPDTSRFFAKAPGYKRLRIILCKVALLVESDAEVLVIQNHMDMHEGKLAIQNDKEGGKRETKESKVFPGYVLVRMEMDDNTWTVVRNTPGVTGFVGIDGKPVPLSRDEFNKMRKPLFPLWRKMVANHDER